MQRPRIDTSEIKKARLQDYAVRFAFGGAISAIAFTLGHYFGLGMGGLFLAFPAILPAALTLAAEEEGRKDAADDAAGATAGALALVPFALFIWRFAERLALAPLLVLATAVWLVSACVLWIPVEAYVERSRARGNLHVGSSIKRS